MLSRRALATKTTTGIVGLEVEPNAHVLLKTVYEQTLRKCAAMPDSYAYKVNLSKFVNTRLKALAETNDHAALEAKFDDGKQIEEVLVHAKAELELLDHVIAKQYWTRISPDVEYIILPPGVHHEDRLELVRDSPPNKAATAP